MALQPEPESSEKMNVPSLPLKVHIVTRDAYIVGALLLPKRDTQSKSGMPRFLDVLNNPALYLKTQGDATSNSTTVTIVDGTRHSFHSFPPREFKRLLLRLDSVLFGSDEVAPDATTHSPMGQIVSDPEDLEMHLRGGIRLYGTVRGGTKAVLFPRADQLFFAATAVRYATPTAPDTARELSFAAVSTRFIECAVPIHSPLSA
jgi:hypothetical protein